MLGWEDSNLRVAESKSAALPLGDTPMDSDNMIISVFCHHVNYRRDYRITSSFL